MNNFNQLYMS